jgi:magnesium transporter
LPSFTPRGAAAMLHAFVPRERVIERVEIGPDDAIPERIIWLDADAPTDAERRKIEAAWELALPSREEMMEIEPSSRLYVENDAAFMTATVISHADDPNPRADPFTFVVHSRRLLTLRYSAPRPVQTYANRIARTPDSCASGEEALVGLLEALVDRIADILEKVSLDLDQLSQRIFAEDGAGTHGTPGQRTDLRQTLKTLAREEDLTSTSRESLLGLLRVVRFFDAVGEQVAKTTIQNCKERLKEINRDIATLAEHAGFESQKIAFLQNATLGMINIEQNQIIKLFSVAAVVLMPPTLIASIYGMNFRNMPELDWIFGYPMAIGLMAIAAAIPYLYFKRRGWL